METQTAHFHCHFPSEFMTPFSSKLFPSLLRFSTSSAATVNIATTFKLFYTAATTTPIPSQDNSTSITPDQLIPPVRQKTPMGKTNKLISQAQLRENWLDSLSCPFPQKADCNGSSVSSNDASNLLKFHGNGSANLGSEWVVGVDPDASGAVALLKPDQSAQVFDSPHLKVLVGGRTRRRLDTKSIVQLLHSFDAPMGLMNMSIGDSSFRDDYK